MSESITPAEPLTPVVPAAIPVATGSEPPAVSSTAPPPAAEPVAVPEPVAEAPPADPAATPTLLTPEEKAAEQAAPAEEAPPAEVAAPEPLVYEPPTLPDGIKLDAERLGAFDKVVGTHRVPPEARQELVNMFLAERRNWEAEARRQQNETFVQTRREWRDQVMGDEELGGSGFDSTRAAAMRMLDQFVSPAHRKSFDQALLYTGMGDHPEMMRFLANLAKKFDAPPPPTVPNSPPPDIGRSGRANGRRFGGFYDNPRSPGNR